ncbi:hypothetical protein ACLOJK_009379 [Asimina triloba]
MGNDFSMASTRIWCSITSIAYDGMAAVRQSSPAPIDIHFRFRRKHRQGPIFMTNPNGADPGTGDVLDNFFDGLHWTVDADPGCLDDMCPIIRASNRRPIAPLSSAALTGVRSWDGPPKSS